MRIVVKQCLRNAPAPVTPVSSQYGTTAGDLMQWLVQWEREPICEVQGTGACRRAHAGRCAGRDGLAVARTAAGGAKQAAYRAGLYRAGRCADHDRFAL